MNIIPKTLTLGLGALVLVGAASASTITASVAYTGGYSTFNAPNSTTTAANQFNATAVNAAIQASCPVGDTCSALTLTEIDFTLTANLQATVRATNGNATTSYIGSITGEGGSFGAPTSGTAVDQTTTVQLIDPLTNDVVDTTPTFAAATTTELKRTPVCSTGSVNGSNYLNCLSVAIGSQLYTGTGTDTETNSYFLSDGSLTPTVTSTYEGSGSVNFTLISSGSSSNGSLQAGVTVTTNTATVVADPTGLTVTYDYTYTETASTTTPEPGTMVLMGAALVGLGFIRRKNVKAN